MSNDRQRGSTSGSSTSHDIDRLAAVLPNLASDMLGPLEHTLKILQDDQRKPFLATLWNQQGSSYRSPWSNTYIPITSSGPLPTARTRALEVAMNDAFSALRDRLWKGGVSSVYLQDGDAGSIEGVALIKKETRSGSTTASYDSIHEFTISPPNHAPSGSYTLTSTVAISKASIGGSTSISTSSQMPITGPSIAAQHASHTRNILQLIEEQELKLRDALNDICLSVVPSSSPTISHSYPPSRLDADMDDSSESRGLLDEFGIDDTMPPTSSSNPAQVRTFTFWLRQFLHLPMRLLAIPVGLFAIAFGFLGRMMRIRPGTTSLRPRNPFGRDARTLQRMDPTSSAERFVRSIEELTGAVRWSRRFGEAEGASSSVAGSSSSGMGRRGSAGGAGARKALPDFWIDSYESALRKAKEEIRVVMVVLTCDEHEDDEVFKRHVLTDPELLNSLTRERILVWGGDIRDVDAYQVSKALQYFRLPFVAFIALQPQSSTLIAASTNSPRMSVISRLEGSPASTLSASSVLAHLTNVVLPRVNPFLARLRTQQAARLEERRLREEQDRAFAVAARKDEERVLRKRAEEGKRKRDEEERRKKEEEVRRVREGSKKWRAWKRGQLQTEGEKEGRRIGVRLGDGRRIVRSFSTEAKVEDVYAFVECSLEADDGERRDAPPDNYEHVFEFRLATTFPRNVLEIDGESGSKKLSQVDWLEKSASLVVEGLEQRRISLGESGGSDDEDEVEEEDEDE